MGGNILPFQSHFFTVLLYRKIPVFSDGFKKFYVGAQRAIDREKMWMNFIECPSDLVIWLLWLDTACPCLYSRKFMSPPVARSGGFGGLRTICGSSFSVFPAPVFRILLYGNTLYRNDLSEDGSGSRHIAHFRFAPGIGVAVRAAFYR